MQYTIVSSGDESNATVFCPGEPPLNIHSSHPNFERVVSALVGGETSYEALRDLVDASVAVATRFDRLTERVTVANGRLYFDGDEVESALTKQVLKFLEAGVEDWKPLVNFFEKVQSNPSEHSRAQLHEWLDRHDFTLTPEGDIVGYKGVAPDGEGYLSIQSGTAIVDGQPTTGRIPTNPGSVVEMPRSEVEFDPSVGCSSGLHVGTWEYASGFAHGAVLEVHVNPRDVVSVPTDCSSQKVRCCRYRVVRVIDVPYSEPVTDTEHSFEVGDTVYDRDGDLATVTDVDGDIVTIQYEDSDLDRVFGKAVYESDDLSHA